MWACEVKMKEKKTKGKAEKYYVQLANKLHFTWGYKKDYTKTLVIALKYY